MANGHRLQDVLEHYSLGQVELFSDVLNRRLLKEYRQQAIAMKAAFATDKKGWDKFMRDLQPRDGQRPGEAPADALVRQLKASGLWRSLKTSQ